MGRVNDLRSIVAEKILAQDRKRVTLSGGILALYCIYFATYYNLSFFVLVSNWLWRFDDYIFFSVVSCVVIKARVWQVTRS